jgi:hypothetical protein
MRGDFRSVHEEDGNMRILPSPLSTYHARDVFNADECGLFFNLLPDKTYSLNGKCSHRGKKSKTELLCSYVQIPMDLKRCSY